jgi:hypothetical protein
VPLIPPRWQQPYLGLESFPKALNVFEIGYFFHLEEAQLTLIRTRRGDLHQLGAALQLGFIRMTGRTLDAFGYVPLGFLQHLGDVLALGRPPMLTSLRALYRRRSTLYEHQQRVYAQALRRRPARLRQLSNPRQTLEVVCFLRITLLELTDRILALADRRITDLRRAATGRGLQRYQEQAFGYANTVHRARQVIDDTALSDAAARE